MEGFYFLKWHFLGSFFLWVSPLFLWVSPLSRDNYTHMLHAKTVKRVINAVQKVRILYQKSKNINHFIMEQLGHWLLSCSVLDELNILVPGIQETLRKRCHFLTSFPPVHWRVLFTKELHSELLLTLIGSVTGSIPSRFSTEQCLAA